MRDILFRGKRIDNGEWVYGSYLRRTNPCIECFEFAEDGVPEPYIFEVAPETVGQYSELKDKNGDKIFEGDIVKLKIPDLKKTVNGIVACGRYTDVDSIDNYDYFGWYIQVRGKCISILQPCSDGIEIEVIGNLHNNSELLEI